ncbi:MAG TPA: tRNA pseudouridine(38-40) synthase TruA [Thermomicrobiales bacterium]
MYRLRLTLAYDGAAFAGSQIQPGQRTVQGVIEGALATLDGAPVRAVFAGRTDTGVHALGQVAHADVHRERGADQWRQGLNGLLPPDVRITNVERVPDRFHARYDATWREYRYTIWNGAVQPPLMRGTTWHRRSPLDVAAMDAAARALIGEHDFAAFAGAGKGLPQAAANTVRTMRAAEWTAERSPEAVAGLALVFTIDGSGFLPHMVRNLVGSLVVIGAGDAPVSWMASLLRGRDRRAAAPTAPPHGLSLWRVRYDEWDGIRAMAVTDRVAGRAGETNV